MTVKVRLFAGLRGLVGDGDVAMTVPVGATIGTVRDRRAAEYPVLEPFLATLVCAVDEEVRPAERVVRDGDVIDVIPPIAGG